MVGESPDVTCVWRHRADSCEEPLGRQPRMERRLERQVRSLTYLIFTPHCRGQMPRVELG